MDTYYSSRLYNDKYVLLGKWTSEIKNFEPFMLPNYTLPYNNTFNELSVSGDISVSERVRVMRRAAEVHKQVRRYIQDYIEPGVSYADICKKLENKTKSIFGQDTLEEGSY